MLCALSLFSVVLHFSSGRIPLCWLFARLKRVIIRHEVKFCWLKLQHRLMMRRELVCKGMLDVSAIFHNWLLFKKFFWMKKVKNLISLMFSTAMSVGKCSHSNPPSILHLKLCKFFRCSAQEIANQSWWRKGSGPSIIVTDFYSSILASSLSGRNSLTQLIGNSSFKNRFSSSNVVSDTKQTPPHPRASSLASSLIECLELSTVAWCVAGNIQL